MIVLIAIEGFILRVVADLVGARVTSWLRTPEKNAAVGGKPGSFHLYGGGVDVGMETLEWQRWVLRGVAREIPEPEKNHIHYQVDGRIWLVIGRVFKHALERARAERPGWAVTERADNDRWRA